MYPADTRGGLIYYYPLLVKEERKQFSLYRQFGQ